MTEKAGEGIAAEHNRALVPLLDKPKMKVDEDGASSEVHSVAALLSGLNEGSILGEVRDLAPVVSEAQVKVDESVIAGKEHPLALATRVMNEGSTPGEVQDVAPVVSEVKMDVDDGCISEQDQNAATLASEVTMEEAEGRTVNQEPLTPVAAIQVTEEVGECLVGRCIIRSARGHVKNLFGKVASYDSTTGLYSVVFEDEHGEDLGLPQLRQLLTAEENRASGMKVSCGKRKLDLLVPSGTASEVKGPASSRQRVDTCEMSARLVMSNQSGSGSDMSENAETLSNSSNFTKEKPSELCVAVQAVDLPPSSGDIAVPEESISHLFSVYNFLRSFSVQLFLSPFGLDDFVAAINCTVQNNLLDAVHVSLLQALRRHLETKSAEGSQCASNCLKCLDWTLLDVLTWPVFLLEYLYVMHSIKNLGGRSFCRSLLAIEYYKLPVAMKLMVLQILCDHIIDSVELRTELEDREGYNEEMEYAMDSSVLPGAGSRAISTRASKDSPYKRTNHIQNLETTPNVTNPDTAVASASQDGNSEYCRICGMDGTLVCCDGCSWNYHSRCIGLNKAFLPLGQWFCPECVVNKLGPTSSRIDRGARGAQMFGIDMHGRLFLGLCNYLLVIGTSSNAESYARYYNHCYVIKVLNILALSDAYTDICRRITEYWKDLPDVFRSERSKIGEEVAARHTPQFSMSMIITPIKANDGNVSLTLKDARGSRTIALPQTNAQHDCVTNQFTVSSREHVEEQKCTTSLDVVTEKDNEVYRQSLCSQKNKHNAPINRACGPSMASSVSHNGPIVTGASNMTQSQPAQSLFRPDLSTSVSKTKGMFREDITRTISTKETFYPSYQSRHRLQLVAERSRNTSGGKPAKLSTVKRQAYLNLYIHGGIAASVAANLAVITSHEGKVSASQMAMNQRKKMATESARQLKACSLAATQFVWPSTEKKLMEVPRDRCGWCLACRSSAVGNKKACFLNTVAANAAKGSARVLSDMRLTRISVSHFPSIVAYLANMAVSLRGLLVGSLQDMQQKERWHKQLQEASNCRTIVPLLLELECSIRAVAFSASWSKLIDEWHVGSSVVSFGVSCPAHQKYGTGVSQSEKTSLASESVTIIDDDNSWTWWSRGNISKRILQRGALLSSTIRKAARQGGKKMMAGLSYHGDFDLPRRTQQFAWRACVGLSQNSSQLALQVRYLDAHIRWKEFIPPDQIPSYGKCLDGDFSALRNGVLCDKKIVDNKTRYALRFPNQKLLPVHITKNILEVEDNQDVNRKLWFSENHVPLYVVREFEQKAGLTSSTPGMLDTNSFTDFYPRRVKEAVFSYLFHKGDVYSCTSCKKDILFRDVVKCSSCQGNCHKECTSRSIGSKEGNDISTLICKLCLQKRKLVLTSYSTNTSYIRPEQKSDGKQPLTAPKIIFKAMEVDAQPIMKVEAQSFAKVAHTIVKAHPVAKVAHTIVKAHPAAKVKGQSFAKVAQPIVNVKAQPLRKVEGHPLAKVEAWPNTNRVTQNIASVQAQLKTTKKSKSEKPRKRKVQMITYFGLVWKKNKNDNDGSDFRANDVILKSKDGVGPLIKPTCCLCKQTYSPDFIYIRCGKCRNWFHGDALQLEEEKIVELVAFQCSRCRKRAIPQCPHSDKPEPGFNEEICATSLQSTMLSGDEAFALPNQDPLLASYGIVEPIG
ncbi:hypothetical protein ACP70R_009369 [Stipagrostis hirtigluma subsp. patula]